MIPENLKSIISGFKIDGAAVTAAPFGTGHINDTYKVAADSGRSYLLQRINHLIFKDVTGLMENIVNVTRHLAEKIKKIPGADPGKEVLTPIENLNGSYFFKDAEGNYWRVFDFLSGTKSYDQVETEKQAHEGGKAFGRFQALLADLDPGRIIDTIPNFHNIEFRLANLDKARKMDPVKRVKEVLPELEFVDSRRELMSRILQMGRTGLLPKRIIHNDTKFNNVLLNEQDEAQCVIDLDTVMPGFVAYDFGDAIRTIINTAAEDEVNLEKITLNIPLFAAFTKAYLHHAAPFIIDTEVRSLVDGVMLIPFMQTVRFLTDYIDGDIYYKIHSPRHNLQRTRAQLQLVRKLEENQQLLKGIILNTWHNENL